MKLSSRSLTARLLAAAGLWTLLALLAGGWALTAAFRNYVERDFDERLYQYLDAMVGATELENEGFVRFTRPLGDQRFAEPYSGLYWQVSVEGHEHFRSRSLWDQELDPNLGEPAFSPRVREVGGPDGQILRLIERDITLPGSEHVFRYMVADNTAEITEEIDRFNALVAWSMGALGAGLLLAMVLQVSFGLRPLRTIRHRLADIRSGQAQRLEGDYPPEIQPLVSEMNAVIEHNDEVVARARTHVGNLAHALKTPLSVMANAADTDREAPLAEVVDAQSRIMQRHIGHHLARARASGRSSLIGVRTEVAPALQELVRAMERIHADRHLTVVLDAEPELAFWGERQDLDEMVGNLLDNACKWAKSRVHVTSRRNDSKSERAALDIVIEDDGAGVGPDERDALFERGRRLDESKPGSGLGLAIVRDIAAITGGSIRLADSELGGLKAVLTLPAIGMNGSRDRRS